ncbi:MAG: metallophosphatase family protein [Deltaproteobacteria bacterium]|nr:metallophosphatase family protein [Candidatus Zymogenaceae bacterium]
MNAQTLVFAGDIHGEFDALRDLVSGDDTLFIAGDLLNFMDFTDITKGILYHAFTPEELAEGLKEYARGNLDRVREGIREISTPGHHRYERVRPLIEDSYERLSRGLSGNTYILFGNDDYPQILKAKLDGKARIVESGIVRAGGLSIGLVSGMPEGDHTIGLAGEIPADTFRQRIFSLGPVDIIVTHIPPKVPELTYDVIAKRQEPSSDALLDYIDHYRPTYAFFGHVHNPKQKSMRIGATTAVNLGFFKKTRTVTRVVVSTMQLQEQRL